MKKRSNDERTSIGLLILMLWGTFSCSFVIAVVGKGNKSQDKNEKVRPPVAYLTVVALGDIPIRRYEMLGKTRNGKQHAVLLPPLVGSVPPSALYYQKTNDLAGVDVEENVTSWTRLLVGFNSTIGINRLSSRSILRLYRRNDHGEYVSYVTLPKLAPSTQSMVILLPREKTESVWQDSPSVSVARLDSQAMIDKSLLIRNYSNRAVTIVMDGFGAKVLQPGKRRSYKLNLNADGQRVKVIQDSDLLKPIMDKWIRPSQNSVSVIAFYNINPKNNAGRSVGVFQTVVTRVSAKSIKPSVDSD